MRMSSNLFNTILQTDMLFSFKIHHMEQCFEMVLIGAWLHAYAHTSKSNEFLGHNK